MYKTGDYIICRSSGIWYISKTYNGQYTLTAHESNTDKTVSFDSNEIVRKIVSKQTILETIERVGYIPILQAPNNKILKEFYDEAMEKFDEIEWIKVIKTAYQHKKGKKLMPFEKICSEKAKGYFHGAISVLLEIPVNKVEDYIAYTVSNDLWLS